MIFGDRVDDVRYLCHGGSRLRDLDFPPKALGRNQYDLAGVLGGG